MNELHNLKLIITHNNLNAKKVIKFLESKFKKHYNLYTLLTSKEIEAVKSEYKYEEKIVISNDSNKFVLNENKVKDDDEEINYKLLKYIEIDEDAKDFSFEILLENHLKFIKEVKIIDPYIRTDYQIRNFIEFSHSLLKASLKTTRIKKITLITGFDSNYQRINNSKLFKEFRKVALLKFNYRFCYFFETGIHDRVIELDDKIKIFLGRGLDFFKNVEKDSHRKYNTLNLKKTYIIILKKMNKTKCQPRL